MNAIVKISACGIIASVLAVTLKSQRREIALVLSLAACAVIAISTVAMLDTVEDYFDRIRDLAEIDTELLQILVRVCGISALTQMTAVFCREAGEGGIGSTVELCGSIAALCTALPLIDTVLSLIGTSLGG